MDNNRGNFEEINEQKFVEQMEQTNPQVFRVGEILEIRGSRLRVEKIEKKKLVLKLLPQTSQPKLDEIGSLKQQLEDLKSQIADDEDKCCPS